MAVTGRCGCSEDASTPARHFKQMARADGKDVAVPNHGCGNALVRPTRRFLTKAHRVLGAAKKAIPTSPLSASASSASRKTGLFVSWFHTIPILGQWASITMASRSNEWARSTATSRATMRSTTTSKSPRACPCPCPRRHTIGLK